MTPAEDLAVRRLRARHLAAHLPWRCLAAPCRLGQGPCAELLRREAPQAARPSLGGPAPAASMDAGEYYLHERLRRLENAPRRLWGPSGGDVGPIYIPSASVLATMTRDDPEVQP